MQRYLISSLILVIVCFALLSVPQASALPVSYNTTAINLGLTSVPRNSSSYDVFTLNQDNWLWEKFNNNTIDSSPLNVTGTITYNTNLNALYKGENNTLDSTTHAYTLTKAVGTNNFVPGQEGKAFSFDGSTYYTSSSSVGPTGASDRSVTFWIKTPSTFVNNAFIWSWGTNSLNGQFASTWTSTASTSKLEVYLGSGSTVYSSTTVFNPNTWYHIGITLGSTGTSLKIYVNGVLDSTQTISTQNTSSTSFTLGALVGGTNLVQTGTIIDELRIYNSAISLAQDQALYMVGKYGQSHTFDGGEYVNLGNTLSFTNTTPFTITIWSKTTNNIEQGIIAKGGSGAIGYDLHWLGGQIVFRLWDGADHAIYTPLTFYNDGNWHYIAGVYDGSGNQNGMKLYVDGSLVVSGSSSIINSFTTSSNVIIGGYSGLGLFLIGQEDNLKVYPYALSSSQITSDYNSISPISSGKQFMSWYNGVVGSPTLTQKLGSTKSTLTLACNLSNTLGTIPVSNLTKIYYGCTQQIKHVDVISGTSTHDFTINNNPYANTYIQMFFTTANFLAISSDGGHNTLATSASSGNNTSYIQNLPATQSNQKLSSNYQIKFNYNNTSPQAVSGTICDINYKPNNTTKQVDSIACDKSIPANTIRYWNGMMINRNANYVTNSTQVFLNSIDQNAYKKLLSLPCTILVSETPCTTFIMTDQTQTDYLVVLTSTHVYYGKAQTALNYLLNHNYALQSYDIVTPLTTSAYEIQNPILQGITLYGFNLNTTINQAGLFTLPSGYTTKTTTINSAIRTIDPRWTNDGTDIPIITTTQSLFPIFLTASNAPSFAAIKVTSGTQIINGQESVYAVAQLDSTRSVEFDLVAGTCANIYIADISVSPTVWNFEGIICATGVNQKTIAYVNTVPFTFYQLKYGVTNSYVPANNGLQTTFHTQASPTTYTVIVRNSTGTVAINQTFTVPANQTVDTRTFNVSSVSKPAALSVTVGGNQIYTAYLGSPLSLSNMASFFHQYFNYQGFDFLSFIPVVFASMFTRNTVGVGMALTVICIATLSWLSIVVVPDQIVYLSIFIAILGMIGYRAYGYF